MHFSVGKDVLYNIVGFARDSVRAHVTTLRPDNFPSDRKEPWLVDFFAPVRIFNQKFDLYIQVVISPPFLIQEPLGCHASSFVVAFYCVY